MTIEEKIREIMLSEEMPDSEKLDRLHALIPAETFKIDSLSTAKPAQVRLLRDGLMVTDAMEKIRCADFLAKEANPKAAESSTAGDDNKRVGPSDSIMVIEYKSCAKDANEETEPKCGANE